MDPLILDNVNKSHRLDRDAVPRPPSQRQLTAPPRQADLAGAARLLSLNMPSARP